MLPRIIPLIGQGGRAKVRLDVLDHITHLIIEKTRLNEAGDRNVLVIALAHLVLLGIAERAGDLLALAPFILFIDRVPVLVFRVDHLKLVLARNSSLQGATRVNLA